MRPIDIKIRLQKKGITQVSIARQLGCSDSLVNQVIHGKAISQRVMQAVALAIQLDEGVVFPRRRQRSIRPINP